MKISESVYQFHLSIKEELRNYGCTDEDIERVYALLESHGDKISKSEINRYVYEYLSELNEEQSVYISNSIFVLGRVIRIESIFSSIQEIYCKKCPEFVIGSTQCQKIESCEMPELVELLGEFMVLTILMGEDGSMNLFTKKLGIINE